ncbi:MAG: paraquat-inducible protein A [Phycisphaerae bacterium]|nr:paraquat-inducible protein A [Phycisphaerae bacterium]
MPEHPETQAADEPRRGWLRAGVFAAVLSLTVACCVAGFGHIRAFDQTIALTNLGGSVEALWKQSLQKISFGWYEGFENRQAALDDANRRLAASGWVMCGGFWALLAIGAVPAWVSLVRGLGRSARAPSALSVYVLMLVAWSSLACGVLLPSVLLVNTQETLVGRFIGEGQAKSIYGAILGAYAGGMWLLASVILCISLGIPLAKLVLLEWARAASRRAARPGGVSRLRASTLLQIAGALKKSSLVEVTVAALFIFLFATRSISGTMAYAGWGVYFYCTHIGATFLAARAIRVRQRSARPGAAPMLEPIPPPTAHAAGQG